MTYPEPPEWAGRGAHDRTGWPNETFREVPPRSHRAPTGEDRYRITREDTGEFRPSQEPYHAEMPTDPALMYRPGTVRVPVEMARGMAREMVVPAEPAPVVPAEPVVQHVILPVPRPDDPVERFDLWCRVVLHMLAIVALVAALWCLGMVIADHGVPLWVPRS